MDDLRCTNFQLIHMSETSLQKIQARCSCSGSRGATVFCPDSDEIADAALSSLQRRRIKLFGSVIESPGFPMQDWSGSTFKRIRNIDDDPEDGLARIDLRDR